MKKILLVALAILVSIGAYAKDMEVMSGSYKNIPKGAIIDVIFDYSDADGNWEVDSEIFDSMTNPDEPKCDDLVNAEGDFIEEFNDECKTRKLRAQKNGKTSKYKMIVKFSLIRVGGVIGRGDMEGTIEITESSSEKTLLKVSFSGIKVASHSWARTSHYMNLKNGYEHVAEALADGF